MKEDVQTVETAAGRASIRLGTGAELMDLRHAVLRAGLPRETAVFPGDDRPDSRHFIAMLDDSRVVGCATFHTSTWNDAPAWQLRGMATDPAVRGGGIGRAMLAYAERRLLGQATIRQMWCNARVPAVGFYEKLGWQVVSEVFEVPTAGPHVKMAKTIREGPE